ncbi:MAG: NAD(P)H-dependent oxidoreductase [Gemmatimonadetes bacterium]|nr:NAD(P)H-dependent oxidoreductase [Gemmatimonadota bacterium]
MTAPLRVLAVCGSLRQGSMNRALLRAAIELAPAGLAITFWDRAGELPLYNADLDVDPRPEPVASLRAACADAQAILFVSPEYNYSIPGVLKNLIDWGSRPQPDPPLKNKPAAVMGASTGISGTMRMQYHLRQVAVILNAPMMPQPEVILPRAVERFGPDGRLADDSTRALVKRFMAAFEQWARLHAPAPRP